MRVSDFLKFYPEYHVRAHQRAYAEYLEGKGLRFLCDFGFENAETIAWEHLKAGDYILGHA